MNKYISKIVKKSAASDRSATLPWIALYPEVYEPMDLMGSKLLN